MRLKLIARSTGLSVFEPKPLYGSDRVCGGSAGCKGPMAWAAAEATCAAAGARLCTLTELADDEARGVGCNYDDKLVWTSSKVTIMPLAM